MSAHHLLGLVVVAAVGACACGGNATTRHAAPTPHKRSTPTPTPTAPAARPVVGWTHAELLRRLDGRRILVAGRAVRIDPGTVVCGGVGPSRAVHGVQPAWVRFRCLQPTFPPGSVAGPDALFVVSVTGPRTFAISGARFSHY